MDPRIAHEDRRRTHTARLRGVPRQLLVTLSILFLVAGCHFGPTIEGCRIIGARSERDPTGYYVVTVLVQNNSPRPVDLEDLFFELTTFDAQDQVIHEGSTITGKGEIERFDVDRLPLTLADSDNRIRKSHVSMKDRRGTVLSDWTIDETVMREPVTAARPQITHSIPQGD